MKIDELPVGSTVRLANGKTGLVESITTWNRPGAGTTVEVRTMNHPRWNQWFDGFVDEQARVIVALEEIVEIVS